MKLAEMPEPAELWDFFNLFFQYCFIFVIGPFARMKLAEMPEPAGLWDMLSKYVSSVGGTGLAVCVCV
jgi:hypothetical protein